jgi:hypothetical protein
MRHTAGCLCGAVRLGFPAGPIAARTCWCRDCQYLAAGGGSYNAAFRTDGMTIDGEIRWYASTADSGRTIERGFCPNCGTHLLARAGGRKDLVMLRIGTLDDHGSVAPQSVIWAESAPQWACFDPDLPRTDRQPPPIA